MVLCEYCFSTPDLAGGVIAQDDGVCEVCGQLTTVYLYRVDPRQFRESNRGRDGRDHDPA
jgi:hypothetical protein